MTSQAGRTVSGQSAGSGQWPEVAGSPPRQGTAGGTGPAVRRPFPALALRLLGPLWL